MATRDPASGATQRELAVWAADCAERVLPLFEAACPKDERPRAAIAAAREWARTGAFSMAAVRKASLDAHAAAREATDDAAIFAARAAGHAVATAHVREHGFGPALYALKCAAARHPDDARAAIIAELRWQWDSLPPHLRPEWERFQAARLPKVLRAAWSEFLKAR